MSLAPRSRPDERAVILNFHGIGDPGREMEPGEERFWVCADRFHDILQAALAHPRPVAFTFDDGNASDVRVGLPALIDADARAHFFIITDRIGTAGSLSADEIARLASHGMHIGTHGATHLPWTELAQRGDLREELDASTRRLSDIVGAPISHAAFPRGMYNRAVLTELRARGFSRAYSVDEGSSRPAAWLQTRYSVIHTDTAESIRALLQSPNRTTGRWPLRTVKRAVKRWR